MDYPSEFTLSTYLDTDAVEGACLAGFLPMSARFSVSPDFPYGEHEPAKAAQPIQTFKITKALEPTRIFYTPKLHIERCILDPRKARITATTRRVSKSFYFSINKVYDETLDSCVNTHGDGWLTPALTSIFRKLHAEMSSRRVKFISVELWRAGRLVAGELGYAAGAAYTSLSGFHNLSGAGTVQLAALASILADSGFTVWDLGMPMGYKSALGGSPLPRTEYLPLLRNAYHQYPVNNLSRELSPVMLSVACTRAG